MSGIRIVARSAVATVCAFAAFGPLAGVAAAQEDSDGPPFGNGGGNGPQPFQVEEPSDNPEDTTTTTAVVEEPVPEPEPEPTTPPPTQPQQPPPTQPQQPPPTVTPTTPPPPPPPPPTTTTPPPDPTTTTSPPGTTAPSPSGGSTPTTARPVADAPVIVFPTKVDGAVSSSTSAPGEVATTEPKTAVKTVPDVGEGTTATSDDPGEARVAGRTQERGNTTGDLAAGSFEESSSSLLPSSTLGAMLLVALVGFLAAGSYCAWLLVFARR